MNTNLSDSETNRVVRHPPNAPESVVTVERLPFAIAAAEADSWDRLLEASDVDPLFGSLEWTKAWDRHFAQRHCIDSYLLVCRSPDGQVVGYFPFCLWHAEMGGPFKVRRLQVTGNLWRGPPTMRTEYTDFCVHPLFRHSCVEAICDHLDQSQDWDDLVLQDMAEESLTVRSLVECLARRHLLRQIGSAMHDDTGFVNVYGDFTAYIAGLGQGTRRRMFNLRHRMEKLGEVSLDFVEGGEVNAALDELNHLHAVRWGEPVFERERLDFHREIATEKARRNELRLSRLRIDGRTVSVLYNIVAGDREYNLQSGFDINAVGRGVSVGYLHLGYSLESAFRDPMVRTYDLLAGMGKNEAFKHRFCSGMRRLRSFQLVRRRLLKQAYRLRDKSWSRRRVEDPMKSTTVVMTAAANPTGQNAARSLAGRVGRLIGIGSRDDSPFAKSKCWAEFHSVEATYDSILASLLAFGKSQSERPVLIPGDDITVKVIAENQSKISQFFRFVMPAPDVTAMLLEKSRFQSWAEDRGYRIPKTAIVDTADQLRTAIAAIPRPLVIKPVVRWPSWDARFPTDKVLSLGANQQLQMPLGELFAHADRFLVQQWIPGGDSDVYFVLVYISRDGVLLGRATGRKILQWPPNAGSTAACISINDVELANICTRILLASGLKGLGSLEVKKSAIDGEYYLIEPTVGRNDHQSMVGLLSGARLTELAVLDALGLRPTYEVADRTALWVDELSTLRRIRYSSDWKREAGLVGPFACRNIGFAAGSVQDPGPTLWSIKRKLF